MTNKTFSFAAFCEYGNSFFNDGKAHETAYNAIRTDIKKAIVKAGYPSNKEELAVIDTINDFDFSNTISAVPELVSDFMHDTERSFNLPAADAKTCPATIKVVAVDKSVSEGVVQFGERKGEKYKTVVDAHEEVKVKNNRTAFKK